MIIENLILPVSSLSSAPTRVLVILNEPGLFLYVLVNAAVAPSAPTATAVTVPSVGAEDVAVHVYLSLEPSFVSVTVYFAPEIIPSVRV